MTSRSKNMPRLSRTTLSALAFLVFCHIGRHQSLAFAPSAQNTPVAPLSHAGRATVSLRLGEATNDERDDKDDGEAAQLRAKAEELRQQIRSMEEKIGPERRARGVPDETTTPPTTPAPEEGRSLRNKRVLVVGANGRVGSMVCRYLLRNFPQIGEVVAAVHYVGEASSRGYGRLSYEVGAEDGIGSIGPAWSAEDRVATFQFSDEMKEYNLQNLRVVEVELLDPVQCMTITEDIDSVIWCATDFNGNKPRAISGLNAAFLFRAVADPTKGRVEIEGLRNILSGLKAAKQSRKWAGRGGVGSVVDDSSTASEATTLLDAPSDPMSFVLLSTSEGAYKNFETPFGEFNGLKRQGEMILKEEFPSLTYTVLQMGKYEDNFVEESLDLLFEESEIKDDSDQSERSRRKINRRDAARAAGDALLDDNLVGKKVEVWTAVR